MPKSLVDVNVFPISVTTPVDADARNAASVETPHQELGNRTFFLLNLLGGPTGINEWVYQDTPRTRIRTIAASSCDNHSLWSLDATTNLVAAASGDKLFFNVSNFLPNGATVVGAKMICTPGAVSRVGGNRLTISLVKITADFGAATTTGTFSNEDGDDGTLTKQTVATAGAAVTLDKATEAIGVVIRSGSPGVNDTLHALQVTYTDPGPQNL